jgi:hypothetical protein
MHGTFKTIETDLFSLESLIAWLEKQPKCKEYCYADNGVCLIGQYLSTSLGCEVLVGSRDFCRLSPGGEDYGRDEYFPDVFHDIAQGYPHTFGAALDRARKSALTSC